MVPYCSCCLCLYFGSSIMLVTYFVNFRYLNDHLFGKELFILFAASAFRKLSSIYVFSYFPFGFEGRIWDLIVSVPGHCLSFYFEHLMQYSRIQIVQFSLFGNTYKIRQLLSIVESNKFKECTSRQEVLSVFRFSVTQLRGRIYSISVELCSISL